MLPFNSRFSVISPQFLSGEHQILYKVDSVLYVDGATNTPTVGDVIETSGATGTVAYVFSVGAPSYIIYERCKRNFPYIR